MPLPLRFLPLLALLLAACALPFGPAPPTPTESDRFAVAVAAAEREPARGLALLEAFAREHPRSALADDAAFRAAELRLRRGEQEPALRHLEWIARRHANGDHADRARLLAAGVERERGNPEAAWAAASGVRLDRLPPETRRGAARLMVDLAEERGERVTALRFLAALRAAERDARRRADLDAEIGSLLRRMDAGELERAAEQLGTRAPAARVRLRQAELALATGERRAAEAALARASRLPLTPEESERLELLSARVASRDAGPGLLSRLPAPGAAAPLERANPLGLSGALGVVLPLSGPFAAFGEESLQGILLAAGLLGDAASGARGLRLVVRDSAGRPETAAAAVRELARDDEVLAILGPLLGDEAEAAAAEAQRVGIPLLTLTRREEVAPERSQVLRLALTPRLEVELVVDYAARTLGARRFAILHPRDEYGQRLRALFWDSVEAHGGEVVGVASYDPEATDFAEPIRSLVGFGLLSSGQKRALARREAMLDRAKRLPRAQAEELRSQAAAVRGPGGEPLPPYIDFDALFIPDAHDNVALIVPQLAFHEVRGVRLLGTSSWNHPALVEIARRHVNGAVFPAALPGESRLPHVIAFERDFENAFGRAPEVFAAEAFDAAGFVLGELARRPRDREALRRALLEPRIADGVTGVFVMRPDGSADKRPHLLGVERGRILSIDETGKAPRVPYARRRAAPDVAAP